MHKISPKMVNHRDLAGEWEEEDTTFTDLDLGFGLQGQCKANPLGLIFAHTFPLIRMKVEPM